MYAKPAKDVGQVRLAIMQWEEKWSAVGDVGGDAKIPDLWRMPALLEICPKDVKEQMLMRLDEIGENYENLKARVISYTTNKAEQAARGGQREATVLMELDHVNGGELYDEDWGNVDEVQREKMCYNHIARDCRTKGNGKGKGRDGGKEYSEGKGEIVKGAGKNGSGQSGGLKGEQKDWGHQGQYWTCGKIGHKSFECRWEVDNVDEDDVDSRKSG